MLANSCQFSFDDLFESAFGRPQTPFERAALKRLTQPERNAAIWSWIRRSGPLMVGQDVDGTDGVRYTSFAVRWPEVIAGSRVADWEWHAGDGGDAPGASLTLVMRRPGQVLPRRIQAIQFGPHRMESPAWHLVLPRGEQAVRQIALELARLLMTTVSDRAR